MVTVAGLPSVDSTDVKMDCHTARQRISKREFVCLINSYLALFVFGLIFLYDNAFAIRNMRKNMRKTKSVNLW